MDIPNSLSFWLIVAYGRLASIHAQANLFSFWTRNSFASMDSKSGNDATDEHKKRIFGEYPYGKEASSQFETDMDR